MQILKEGGIEALECRMRDEAEARRPPFQRPQSKYSYYFAWMSGRITERFPALEEPERDQMLLMDSGQLDSLLDNKDVTAAMLLNVAEKGLTWEMCQRLSNGAGSPLIGN